MERPEWPDILEAPSQLTSTGLISIVHYSPDKNPRNRGSNLVITFHFSYPLALYAINQI